MFYLPTFMGMLIQFFVDYIKHRLTAKSRHGTHSPFVYKLVDEVIYDFSAKKVYDEIEKQRKKLLNDGRAGLNTRLLQLMYRLAYNHPSQMVILLGPDLGKESLYLAKAKPGTLIVTQRIEDSFSLDFVYITGAYTKETMLNYFNTCLPKVHENTLLVFNDIYRSKGMKEAWKEIKAHPKVTVTIDLFWIGLVYFRKGQVKEHFKIKF